MYSAISSDVGARHYVVQRGSVKAWRGCGAARRGKHRPPANSHVQNPRSGRYSTPKRLQSNAPDRNRRRRRYQFQERPHGVDGAAFITSSEERTQHGEEKNHASGRRPRCQGGRARHRNRGRAVARGTRGGRRPGEDRSLPHDIQGRRARGRHAVAAQQERPAHGQRARFHRSGDRPRAGRGRRRRRLPRDWRRAGERRSGRFARLHHRGTPSTATARSSQSIPSTSCSPRR